MVILVKENLVKGATSHVDTEGSKVVVVLCQKFRSFTQEFASYLIP